MRLRSFATLAVASDVTLESLNFSDRQHADVTVRVFPRPAPAQTASWEEAGDADSHLVRSALVGSTLIMEFDLGGLIHIQLDPIAHQITVHDPDNIDAGTLDHLIADQALPMYASLVGEDVLHGSAVAIGGGAIVALGDSGAGKSTFASHLLARGGRLLTDDSVVLDFSDSIAGVHPVSRFVRLFDDSLDDAFSIRPPSFDVGSHTVKQHVHLPDSKLMGTTEPVPILLMLDLNQDRTHAPRRPSASERLAILDRSLLGLIADSATAKHMRFERLLFLLEILPIWQIGLDRTPAGTQRSIDHILELVTPIGA